MGVLLVEDRNGVRRIPLPRQMTIGRSPGNDLVLSAKFASRRHARIWRQGERFILEDLSSTNGTFVNGQRLVRPRFLNHNDVIMMGDGQLIFAEGARPVTKQMPSRGTPRPMVSQIFCRQCGAINHPQAVTCAFCGHSLGGGAWPSGSQVPVQVPERRSFTPTGPLVVRPFPPTETPARQRRGSGAWMLILLLAIIAVTFLTILAVLVFYVVS